MKKVILLCLLSIGLTTSIFAQKPLFSGVKVGVNADLQITHLARQHNYGFSLMNYDVPLLRYAGGLSAAFLWDDTYGVQIEAIYSSQGGGYSGFLSRGDVEKKVDLSYIKVPITYRHFVPLDIYDPNSPILNFTIGGQFAYLLDAKVQYKLDGVEETFAEAHSSNVTAEKFPGFDEDRELFLEYDYAIVLGVGVEIPLENDLSLQIEGRGNIGVRDINAREWRFGHHERGEYNASRNLTGAIRVGILYTIY